MFAAYPDRLARRREVGSDRFALSSGTGARLAKSTGTLTGEFLVALEVRSVEGAAKGADGRMRGPSPLDEPRITIASPVEPDWIVPNSREGVYTFYPSERKMRAPKIES